MLRTLVLAAAALAAPAAAGVIHGIVLEHATGLVLARARVRLDALSGDRLEHLATQLTNRAGQFHFNALPKGHYLLSAVRTGFAEARYGQKRGSAPGLPIILEGEAVTFIEMRLKRYAAISGKVLDENRVGLPGMNVVAYPVALPLRMAGAGKTDDRGMYRIPGLAPGRYYVRAAAHELEDGSGLLPTFAPETGSAREASIYGVDLDGEALDVSIYPLPGRLVRISGIITCAALPGPITVSLSSDTGRKQTSSACAGRYSFEGLSPGDYELLAQMGQGEAAAAAHLEIFIDRTLDNVHLQLLEAPLVRFEAMERDRTRIRPGEGPPILARRKDLAGEGEVVKITTASKRMLPGYWEMTAQVPANRYLYSMGGGAYRKQSKAGQDPDWFEVYLGIKERPWVETTLAAGTATLSGRVVSRTEPVAAAPVYVWPVTPETRRRMNGMKTARTDAQGLYKIEGLAPGAYLVLSSFDLGDITEPMLREARAAEVTLEESQSAARDLTLYKVE